MSMNLFEDALFTSIPVLNLVTGESGWKGISAHVDTALPEEWGQKSKRNQQSISLTKEDVFFTVL